MLVKQTKFWKFFSSVKLVIWLLAIIAALSLIGTFIPQNEEPNVYIDKFGHAGYQFLLTTGLSAIYSAWWFIFFLILLSLNLVVCLLNRLIFKVRFLGTFISHFSILIILLGALIGMAFGQKGMIKINKGEVASSFLGRNEKQVNLGFSIRLDEFIYNENIDPKEKLLVYPVQKGGVCALEAIAQIPTEISAESKIADTGYKVRILRYLPDFVMDTSTKSAASRSAEPNNPAIEIELQDKSGKLATFWVFAHFPDMHQKAGTDFKFIYKWVGRQPKDFISKVAILKDAKEVMSRDIRVNKPLSFGGYTFFQYSYDQDQLGWSGLQVSKDPGVPVVYSGFILLITGLIVIFYVNPLLQRS